MWIKLVAMPPMTGVASGFITSAPIQVLHMIGSKLATIHRTQNVTSDSAEGVDAQCAIRKVKSGWLRDAPLAERVSY
jgi:hypothetical protein